MARFGDLEAAIMDVMWAAEAPARVREVVGQLDRDPPPAFNTVQTVMENLSRKGWLSRRKTGRAHWYVPARSREEYVAVLMGEALAFAGDRAATLVRLLEDMDMDPTEIAQLRAALDSASGGPGQP